MPEHVKQKLAEIQAHLRSDMPGARWVAPEAVHLTLKFLGRISPTTVAGITRAMEETATGTTPFLLRVRGLGVFPNPKRVQVVWAGVTGDLRVLGELQKRLDADLGKSGFVPETRVFTAHLTLARIRDDASPAERDAVGKRVQKTEFEGSEFAVDSISLMRSDLRREGPLYTRMVGVPFGPKDTR